MQDGLCTKLHNLDSIREQDTVGQILWSQQMRATDYLSRWIALKESMLPVQSKEQDCTS